jgi:hypothetical protein
LSDVFLSQELCFIDQYAGWFFGDANLPEVRFGAERQRIIGDANPRCDLSAGPIIEPGRRDLHDLAAEANGLNDWARTKQPSEIRAGAADILGRLAYRRGQFSDAARHHDEAARCSSGSRRGA